MSILRKSCLIAFLLLAWPALVIAQEPGYQLNPGDVLIISVWKEQDLQREVLVLPDGHISFPLAGHLIAAGRTAQELQNELTQRLQKYIPDAVVTVSVKEPIGNKVYVLGAVNKPGEFLVTRPITVMQALSLAGGLTPFGSESRINIIRHEGTKEIAIPFEYAAVKDGENLDSNIVLKSGDVVVVSSKSLF